MNTVAGWTLQDLETWCDGQRVPRFRAKQIFQWVQEKGVLNADQMLNLPQSLRDELRGQEALRPERLQHSSDEQTTKYLWQLGDGKLVESVLIRAPGRLTVCVSSQVGCAARCAFCASGKKGLLRNLTVAEIAEQVLRINHDLEEENLRVSHVVFMGMGEPIDNLDNVIKAIQLLNHPHGLNIARRRITISTVGVIEGIDRLASLRLGVNLVLSLHAPDQALRKRLIPYARKNPLQELLGAMDRFSKATKRDVTYEYILIDDFNASPQQAEELARLLKGRQCTVNLIPYNPVPMLRMKRPKTVDIQQFRKILHERGIRNTCRYTKGDDIAAACGQLALQESSFC